MASEEIENVLDDLYKEAVKLTPEEFNDLLKEATDKEKGEYE